jgi:hypothetical protein
MNLNFPEIKTDSAVVPEMEPELIVKPGRLVMEVGQVVNLQAYTRNSIGETAVLAGVRFSSDNPLVVSVNSDDGSIRLLSAGAATIRAQWKDLQASVMVTVVQSMAQTPLSYAIAVDNSQSMSGRLPLAKFLAQSFYDSINVAKDSVSLLTFTTDSQEIKPLAEDLTLSAPDFQNIQPSEGKTSIATAIEGCLSEFAGVPAAQRIILIISDGGDYLLEDKDAMDETISIAKAFKDSGGIICVAGISAFAAGYDLLQRIATEGFFLNINASGDYSTQYADSGIVSGWIGFFCGAQPTLAYSPKAQKQFELPWADPEDGGAQPKYEAVSTRRIDVAGGYQNIKALIGPKSLASGTATASSESPAARAFAAFESIGNGWSSAIGNKAAWLQFQFLVPRRVLAYEITFPSNPASLPASWVFQGSPDGINWYALDVQTGFVAFAGQKVRFEIANPNVTVQYYQISFSAAAAGATAVGVGRLQLYGIGDPEVGFARCWSCLNLQDAQDKAFALAGIIAASKMNLKRQRIPGVIVTPNSGAIINGISLGFSVAGYPTARVRYTIGVNAHPQIPSFDEVASQANGIEWDGNPVVLSVPAGFTDKVYVRAVARYQDYQDSIYTEAVFTRQ